MSLISSVSGIRGTIGGFPGDCLSPVDIIAHVSAFARLLKKDHPRPKVVLGRDARISGSLVNGLVESCLMAMGVDVVQTGLSTTPSVEMAVIHHRANGGIILTASHNPKNWNALKLLNQSGEFISEADGLQLKQWSVEQKFEYATIEHLGQQVTDEQSIERHIDALLSMPDICTELIRSKKFRVVADCINSTAAIALPPLFEALHVKYELLNSEMNGQFMHNPEPLPEHLEQLLKACKTGFDMGIAVDPDVDRLALVDENGSYFGEEYSLVLAADYMLGLRSGNTVSNLSSSRALRDLTHAKGGSYAASAVGEVHVVRKMKETNALVGGEGNGGIILPALHYGRDAIAGIAIALSHLAQSGKTLSELKRSYPAYSMFKDKVSLSDQIDFHELTLGLSRLIPGGIADWTDGLKIDFPDCWVHIRKSNTEPIVRIYSEAHNLDEARVLCDRFKNAIEHFK